MSQNPRRSSLSINSTSSYASPSLRQRTGTLSYSIPTPQAFITPEPLYHHRRMLPAQSGISSNVNPRPQSLVSLPHLQRAQLRSNQDRHHHFNSQSNQYPSSSVPRPLSDIFNLADDEADDGGGSGDACSHRSGSPEPHGRLSGEVDERDRSNPLVLHNARLQLARPPTPPRPPALDPPSSIPPIMMRGGHHWRDSNRSGLPSGSLAGPPPVSKANNENVDPLSETFKELRLQRKRSAALLAHPPHPHLSSVVRTGPAAATMSLEPVHAVISPTVAVGPVPPTRSWGSRPAVERRCSLPADGIPVHGACYAPREPSGKGGKAGELLEQVMSREPVRLRDVVCRITFTFDEHHPCAAGCRRAMVLLGRLGTTLPPGPMDPVRVGEMTVRPPLPSIRHEPCGPGKVPQVDVEWTDGTWQAFEPLKMTPDQILKNCHFDPTRAF
ncbi:hypothetical protein CROQUDRAFT_661192 [Cronartium quercuum f. sp. fusiforme G11]|uniref:Uncharacterized protein n=1 Tax=Cronartium quercuum f. sp. fusiforme G11 TaxID=708437 RepID=A0A9P6NH35_9BASI|nr:hypothetical protein CROQUDRAFT_661192 [Cronartium quercuum f. sp. fusiforme G11]